MLSGPVVFGGVPNVLSIGGALLILSSDVAPLASSHSSRIRILK
jgi:hypothetical protein